MSAIISMYKDISGHLGVCKKEKLQDMHFGTEYDFLYVCMKKIEGDGVNLEEISFTALRC